MNKHLIEQIRQLSANYKEIQSVILFGSRAQGDHHLYSDIDIAVKAPELSEAEWVEFTFALDEQLDTLLKVDTVLYDTASEPLRQEIDRCQQVLYERAVY